MKEKEIVKFWLEEVVIGLNLCPFAKAPYEKGLLDISLCLFLEEEKRTHFFLDVLEKVCLHSEKEFNAIIAFPRVLDDFYDFHDWVGFLEDMLIKQKMENVVQLVTFHPDFHFAITPGQQMHPRAHLVNSSPYPAIHILKSLALNDALKNTEDAEKISKNNELKLQALSLDELKARYFWKKDLV